MCEQVTPSTITVQSQSPVWLKVIPTNIINVDELTGKSDGLSQSNSDGDLVTVHIHYAIWATVSCGGYSTGTAVIRSRAA